MQMVLIFLVMSHCYNNQGINFNLSWGFRSNYQNYINILCEHASISINLFFSKKIMQNAKIDN